MIRRLLIANRGEIAIRVAGTARVRGVETVAVYSDADAGAPHVRACDAAVRIGPAAAAESYLRMDRVLDAAQAAGADAIHPGYGFLSENADFAQAVIDAGLIWVGPPPAAIRAMGAKDAAKRAMIAAGVPVVPGYQGEEQDPALLAREAEAIGYPVLIKASAGGGGKGMRRVDGAADFAEALERARSEAASSFGDDRVLVEKFVENPRHIEVQVFGDSHGSVIHLFERDCSAQRRHQKVIEEAPAPGLTEAWRAAICDAAVRAATAVGYAGAGTVEFVADADAIAAHASDPERVAPGGFYFLEMNTRLQVEHPVTEAITGLDLVALQLDVAEGERLPPQHAVTRSGHAIEARLYAEDPAKGFLPQSGRLNALALPTGLSGIRVDAGVETGSEIGTAYDPMIAKVIAHGPDRETARRRLVDALGATILDGIEGNTAFLARLADHCDFRTGAVDTGMIARTGDALTDPDIATAEDLTLAAAALAGLLDPPSPLTQWRAWGDGAAPITVAEGDDRHTVFVERTPTGLTAETPHGPVSLDLAALEDGRWMIGAAGMARTIRLHRAMGKVTIADGPRRLSLTGHNPEETADEVASGDSVHAPLPGLLRALPVAAGDTVAAGQVVAVIEAMKMEHALRAPRDGVVAATPAEAGMQVAEGAVLVALEPIEGAPA